MRPIDIAWEHYQELRAKARALGQFASRKSEASYAASSECNRIYRLSEEVLEGAISAAYGDARWRVRNGVCRVSRAETFQPSIGWINKQYTDDEVRGFLSAAPTPPPQTHAVAKATIIFSEAPRQSFLSRLWRGIAS